jgi:prepilin-type N-terminal cleavage/methylation domain-containing protein/prepilin-type processing-associated H-X9-DG protein
MQRSHSLPRRGFTLIELLTVIAIIGILAAILIPTVGAVRRKARSAECVSRLRQIGIAIRLYADENKGFVVPDRVDGQNNWGPILVPYMAMKHTSGNLQLTDLPPGSDYSKDSRYFYMCPDSPIPVTWRAWGNYATHPVIMPRVSTPQDRLGKFKLSAIPRPSQIILIADGSQLNGNGSGTAGDTTGASGSSTTNFDRTYNAGLSSQPHDAVADAGYNNTDGTAGHIRYRHNNVANCLYADGHVRGNARGSLTYGNFIEK